MDRIQEITEEIREGLLGWLEHEPTAEETLEAVRAAWQGLTGEECSARWSEDGDSIIVSWPLRVVVVTARVE